MGRRRRDPRLHSATLHYHVYAECSGLHQGRHYPATSDRTACRQFAGGCRFINRATTAGLGRLAGRAMPARRDRPTGRLHRQPVPATLTTHPVSSVRQQDVQRSGHVGGVHGVVLTDIPECEAPTACRPVAHRPRWSPGPVDLAQPRAGTGPARAAGARSRHGRRPPPEPRPRQAGHGELTTTNHRRGHDTSTRTALTPHQSPPGRHRASLNCYRRLSGISTCWRASKSSTHLPVPSTTDSSGLSAR